MLIVDLFCGAGGLHIGFKEAGYRIGLSVDNNENVKKTHMYNHPFVPFWNRDIREIDTNEIREVLDYESLDGIIGGPPCQGFSTIGRRVSSKPEVRNTYDPRNELVDEYIRLVRELQPKFFLMENVKGILTWDKGEFINNIIEKFKDCGYTVDFKLINMADYGVPQTRERVFILGNRLNQPVSFPAPTHSGVPTDGLKPWVGSWDSIKDLVKHEEDPGFNHVSLKHTEKNIERYKLIPEGGRLPEDALPPELYRKNFGNTFKRLDRNKPALTMVPGNDAFPIHPILNRSLTVREAARIQTFPDNIIFKGNRRQQGHQVGNAVPPLFSKILARHIKETILKEKQLEFEFTD